MRLPDWQSRLSLVIKDHQKDSFEWGRNDCCLFICNAIEAMTGIDPATPFFRGNYHSKEEGYALIAEFCGGGIEKMVEKMAETHGYVEVHPNFAQRGDVGLYIDRDAGPTLALSLGTQWAFLKESGLGYLPRASVTRVWRV